MLFSLHLVSSLPLLGSFVPLSFFVFLFFFLGRPSTSLLAHHCSTAVLFRVCVKPPHPVRSKVTSALPLEKSAGCPYCVTGYAKRQSLWCACHQSVLCGVRHEHTVALARNHAAYVARGVPSLQCVLLTRNCHSAHGLLMSLSLGRWAGDCVRSEDRQVLLSRRGVFGGVPTFTPRFSPFCLSPLCTTS